MFSGSLSFVWYDHGVHIHFDIPSYSPFLNCGYTNATSLEHHYYQLYCPILAFLLCFAMVYSVG